MPRDNKGSGVAEDEVNAIVQGAINDYIENQNVGISKGSIDCSTNPDYPPANQGWYYRASASGKIGGINGVEVEKGDRLECCVDNSPSGDHATIGMNWQIIQANVDVQTKITIRVASDAEMIDASLNVKQYDFVIRTDKNNALYQLTGTDQTQIQNWEAISGGSGTAIPSKVVEKVVVSGALPITDGLYAFAGTPTGGMPTGAVGDILKRLSGAWSVDTTYDNADPSIYSKSDGKTYNKKLNASGAKTWVVAIEPQEYIVKSTGDNTLQGGYTTLQNADNAYVASASAVGKCKLLDALLNESATINSNNITIIGDGSIARSPTQLSKLTLSESSHRVTVRGILLGSTSTATPLEIKSTGTLTENGTPNVARGKHSIENCTFTTTGTIAVDIIPNNTDPSLNSSTFYTFLSSDFGLKQVVFRDRTGTPALVTITSCQNGLGVVGAGYVVIKYASPGFTFLGSSSSTIIDFDIATPISYSLLQKYSLLQSLAVPLGAKIINDGPGGQNEIVECKTGYSLSAGAAIDLTKYKIPNGTYILPNKTSNYIITADELDNQVISLSAQTVSSLTYTLANPNQPAKHRIVYIDVPSTIGSIGTSFITINNTKLNLGATHQFTWITSKNSWSLEKINQITGAPGKIVVTGPNGVGIAVSDATPVIEETVTRYSDLPAPSVTNINKRYWVRYSNLIMSVSTYNDLPTASSGNNGQYYDVLTTTVYNLKLNGIYQSNGATWNRISSYATFINATFDPGVNGYKPSGSYVCANVSGSIFQWNKYQESISLSGYQTYIENPTENRLLATDINGKNIQTDYLVTDIYTPVGAVLAFAGATAPAGYLLCNGAEISRTTYANLFAVIGTTYGSGNGSTTFTLPDFRGYFLRGLDPTKTVDSNNASGSTTAGASARTLGSLQADNIISHNHTQWVTRWSQLAPYGSNARVVAEGPYFTQDASTQNTGGAETRPKNIAVNYIIKR